jgi:hypothetical protein
MDPYLEEPSGWSSVHLALIVAIQAELNRVLPEGYVARIDEYVWVRDTDDGDDRFLTRPDVYIPQARRTGNGTATLTRPSTLPTVRGTLPNNKKRKQRYLQVATARGREVLTAIEILSPSNKDAGEDRDAYKQKRRGYLGSVNFVEIDLLREGNRFPAGRPVPPPSDYRVFMCRRDEFPDTETWAINLRDGLPSIPIPITREIPAVSLDLKSALTRVYDEGRYAEEIDYTLPPVPPLRSLDAEWAVDLLKKAARKRKK